MGMAGGGVPSPAPPPPRLSRPPPHLVPACGGAAGRGGGRRWRRRGSRPCPWRWSRGAAGTPAPGSAPPAAPPPAPRSCRQGLGRGRGRADGSLGGQGGGWLGGPPAPHRHRGPSPWIPAPRLTDVGGEPVLGPGAAVESGDGAAGAVGSPAAHPGVGRHGGQCRQRARPLSPEPAGGPLGAGRGAAAGTPAGTSVTMAGELRRSAPPSHPQRPPARCTGGDILRGPPQHPAGGLSIPWVGPNIPSVQVLTPQGIKLCIPWIQPPVLHRYIPQYPMGAAPNAPQI